MHKQRVAALALLAASPLVSTPAWAQTPPATAEAAPAAGKPKPPPYSLPWALRPVVPATVARLDSVIAFYKPDAADSGGRTIVEMLTVSYKIIPDLALLLRLGYTTDTPPEPPIGDSRSAFQNPVIGGLYGLTPSEDTRFGLFFGVAAPLGQGDNSATGTSNADHLQAQGAGARARSAMDNAMFAPNYLTLIPGVGFAFVKDGLTAQIEATLLFLNKVKGDKLDTNADGDKDDGLLINSTAGLHLGYFVIPRLSLGGEVRYQRLLKRPEVLESSQAAVDTATFAVGPRLHFKLGETMWLRPGISYGRPLDKPMTDANYNIVQVDIPVVF